MAEAFVFDRWGRSWADTIFVCVTYLRGDHTDSSGHHPGFGRDTSLKVLQRWEAEMPDTGAPDLNVSAGLADTLRPWEGFNYWTFDSWALAVDVVSAFVGQPGTITETAFLEQMSDVMTQATGLGWQVPIIVATLFVLKKSGWFWDLLI